MQTLVIDIGNTRLCWRHRDGTGEVQSGTASHEAIADVLSDLPCAESIAISSVVPAHEPELEKWLRRTDRPAALWVRSGADLGDRVCTDEPHRTGADRALCALAWGASGEHRSAVIIDAGSAVTVDAVSASGHLLGGWIAPGLGALGAGLRQVAPSLPDPTVVSASSSDPEPRQMLPWASDTKLAIGGGIESLFIGGIQALRDRVQSGLGDGAVTVLTGGDSDLLMQALEPAVLRPGLVLDGLEALLRGAADAQ